MDTEVGLFEDERDANRRSTVAVLEAVLAELGHDLAQVRAGDAGDRWRVEHDGAVVDIALVERDDFTHLRVTSPVLVPGPGGETDKLYAKLLRLNGDTLFGAAFALREGEIVLVLERSTIDLDRSEIRDAVIRMRDYAAHYRRALAAEPR